MIIETIASWSDRAMTATKQTAVACDETSWVGGYDAVTKVTVDRKIVSKVFPAIKPKSFVT